MHLYLQGLSNTSKKCTIPWHGSCFKRQEAAYVRGDMRRFLGVLFLLSIVLMSFGITKVKRGVLFFGWHPLRMTVPVTPLTAVNEKPSQKIAIKDLKSY
jgi:hypothetical protein